MTNKGEVYLNKLIEDMYSLGENTKNNILSINKEDFDKLVVGVGVEKYYHVFNQEDMMDPYEPFLGILGDIVCKHSIDIEDLFDRANVYRLHRNIFRTYFLNQSCERMDTVVISEL